MSGVIADSTGRYVVEIEHDIHEGTLLNSERALECGLDEIRSELIRRCQGIRDHLTVKLSEEGVGWMTRTGNRLWRLGLS
jgi:hypothetical protein